ncbi:MAG: N-acetyl-gamma-glutamyl-phosphate reductase [Vicinamibacteraceae bacterium]|nr:N-acetyl-gamma-glutamyl-phosphate reductase [Vicinamibacteraceae bacterium]
MTQEPLDVPASPLRVAIVGATGYSGVELVRRLARHPGAIVTGAYGSSASEAPRRLPGLARIWDGEVQPFDAGRVAHENDAAMLALPERAAAEIAPALLAAGLRVIDLSGAFRLRDEGARARWYPATGALPEGTVYGLAERDSAAIAGARLVSCPGCYPTAALLALGPLADAGLLAGDVIVDAKSGISGAGKAPSDRTHFSENHGSVAAYGVFTHRHTAEIEQELRHAVTFVPHLVPLDRGILETIYVRVPGGTTAADVASAFESAYAEAPFVRLTGTALPEIKHVAYTNFCDIGWVLDEAGGRLVVIACLDNLVKGAAGQAIQNFNVAFGLDERAGLL